MKRLRTHTPPDWRKFDRGAASQYVQLPRAAARPAAPSRQARRSIRGILEAFKQFTESSNVNHLGISRSAGKLKPRPEKEALALFSTYVMGNISNRGGDVLRELPSGTGFVDIVIRLGSQSECAREDAKDSGSKDVNREDAPWKRRRPIPLVDDVVEAVPSGYRSRLRDRPVAKPYVAPWTGTGQGKVTPPAARGSHWPSSRSGS